MVIEKKHPEARTPQELFDMIEAATPYTGDGFLKPATTADCPGSCTDGVLQNAGHPAGALHAGVELA